ncbi:uracil-DNA glycosylase [Bacteriovorax sp. DB6_IX]|nr:uracil-DNA glycosylase [Bacteriovorax sp. DB6_IX]
MMKLEKSWNEVLKSELEADYFQELINFLGKEREQERVIYPQENDIFSAFNETPFDKVKVVLIGQDPYHGPDQAHGMSFSVKPGVKIPPSLRNIYKELHEDLGVEIPEHGFLLNWAREGVLLLNACLTVEQGKAGSHHKKGWEKFTDKVIEVLNEEKENLVFILWGSPAQKKAKKVDESRHHVIKSVHPSPLSSYRGFFGSKPFSQTNGYLKSQGITEINWELPLSIDEVMDAQNS